MSLSTCYGPDVEALADVDVGLRNVSSDAVDEFVLRQWNDVARTLGFLFPLTTVTRGLRTRRGGLLGLNSVALAAFDQWLRERPRVLGAEIPASARVARAQARQEILLGYAEQKPGLLWYLEEPADSLVGGGCFDRGQAATLSGRAFADDNAPGYFRDGTGGPPQGTCGWAGPVKVSIGTFPWTYGGRLHRTPPGLDWESVGTWTPAVIGMRLCASLWLPEGNLRQDARQVVQYYRNFQRNTDAALQGIPAHDPKIATPGALYRRGLLLHAEQDSLETHTLDTPRGPLAASAYNYCIRRFAAFFAMRRTLLTRAEELTPDLIGTLAKNDDPCLKPYQQPGVR